jgi:hypothetical protein
LATSPRRQGEPSRCEESTETGRTYTMETAEESGSAEESARPERGAPSTGGFLYPDPVLTWSLFTWNPAWEGRS